MLVLTVAPAHAYRPLVTEDTGTVDVGEVEVDLGAEVEGTNRTLWSGRAVVGIGLAPEVEVQVEVGAGALDTPGERGRSGLLDSAIRVKSRLLEETPRRPALLAAIALRVPTAGGREGFGDDGVDVGALAVASKELGPFAVMLNLGHVFVTADTGLSAWFASAAADYRLTETFSVVAEVVSSFGARDASDSVVVRGGAIARLSPRLAIDAAAGVGLTRGAPDVQVTAGLTLGW